MESTPQRRRRPALSCIECRRRKIKCDRNSPCSHCVTAKSDCTYKIYGTRHVTQRQSQPHQVARSRSSPSVFSTTAITQPRQSTTDRSITELGIAPSAAQSVTATGGVEQTETLGKRYNSPRQLHHPREMQCDLVDLQRRIRKLEQSSTDCSIFASSGTEADVLIDRSRLQSSHISLNKTRILSASHWKTNTPEVSSTKMGPPI